MLLRIMQMRRAKKHPVKKWEVSIIEIRNDVGKSYKVTRKIPEMSVAETKMFSSKKKAKRQFDEWLQ